MTMDTQNKRLVEVVAAYGANPERWPTDDRELYAKLLEASKDAPWLAEAQSLDAALATSSAPQFSSDLQQSILATAANTPQVKPEASGKIVDFQAKAIAPPPKSARSTPSRILRMPEAAMLAASLLIGVWAGGSGLLETTLSTVDVSLAQLSQSEDEDNFISALVGVTEADSEGLL